MGVRLELHRHMAGVVETSWSLGNIDRAITGPASTTRSPRGTCDRRQAALAFLRTVVRRDWKNVWIRACAVNGKCRDLGIPVRGDSEECVYSSTPLLAFLCARAHKSAWILQM